MYPLFQIYIIPFQSILSSIDTAPNDTSYFSQYLVVKPIESC